MRLALSGFAIIEYYHGDSLLALVWAIASCTAWLMSEAWDIAREKSKDDLCGKD